MGTETARMHELLTNNSASSQTALMSTHICRYIELNAEILLRIHSRMRKKKNIDNSHFAIVSLSYYRCLLLLIYTLCYPHSKSISFVSCHHKILYINRMVDLPIESVDIVLSIRSLLVILFQQTNAHT